MFPKFIRSSHHSQCCCLYWEVIALDIFCSTLEANIFLTSLYTILCSPYNPVTDGQKLSLPCHLQFVAPSATELQIINPISCYVWVVVNRDFFSHPHNTVVALRKVICKGNYLINILDYCVQWVSTKYRGGYYFDCRLFNEWFIHCVYGHLYRTVKYKKNALSLMSILVWK